MLKQLSPAHSAGISSLTLTEDGLTLAVTSLDHTATLWDMRSFSRTAVLKGHKDAVNCGLFVSVASGAGELPLFLTGGDDRSVCVWDSRNLATPAAKIKGYNDGVDKFALSGDRQSLYSACDDGCLYWHSLQSLPEFKLLDKFMVSENTVNDVVVVSSPAGGGSDIVLSAGEDHSVRSWKGSAIVEDPTERLIASFDEFDNAVNHLTHRNGWVWAAVAQCVYAFDFNSSTGAFGEQGRTYSGHTDYVRGVELLSDTTMLTVSDDMTCIEWDLLSCDAIRQVKLHDDLVMAMAVHFEAGVAKALISGCEDGTVRVWSLPFQTQTLEAPRDNRAE